MSIPKAIHDFPKQFAFEPEIVNGAKLKSEYRQYIVCGMGGSHLAAGIVKAWNSKLPILIHRDYGLPGLPPEDLKNSLIIASSYSGNTEETLSALDEAVERGLDTVCVSIGGKMLEIAKGKALPHIQLPDTDIQPRMALGFCAVAIMKIINNTAGLAELKELSKMFNATIFENDAEELSKILIGSVPVIYASERNRALAQNWKIKFNETGKIPAFYNTLPELNHNEMTGFDVRQTTRDLSSNFLFLFIKDKDDDAKILKRIEVLQNLYKDRGLPVKILELEGSARFDKLFGSLILADWTAYFLAVNYEVEPEQVPMVEEFKRLIA